MGSQLCCANSTQPDLLEGPEEHQNKKRERSISNRSEGKSYEVNHNLLLHATQHFEDSFAQNTNPDSVENHDLSTAAKMYESGILNSAGKERILTSAGKERPLRVKRDSLYLSDQKVENNSSADTKGTLSSKEEKDKQPLLSSSEDALSRNQTIAIPNKKDERPLVSEFSLEDQDQTLQQQLLAASPERRTKDSESFVKEIVSETVKSMSEPALKELVNDYLNEIANRLARKTLADEKQEIIAVIPVPEIFEDSQIIECSPATEVQENIEEKTVNTIQEVQIVQEKHDEDIVDTRQEKIDSSPVLESEKTSVEALEAPKDLPVELLKLDDNTQGVKHSNKLRSFSNRRFTVQYIPKTSQIYKEEDVQASTAGSRVSLDNDFLDTTESSEMLQTERNCASEILDTLSQTSVFTNDKKHATTQLEIKSIKLNYDDINFPPLSQLPTTTIQTTAQPKTRKPKSRKFMTSISTTNRSTMMSQTLTSLTDSIQDLEEGVKRRRTRHFRYYPKASN
eukprot:CAMPEP_0176422418 /NCGR_PEP_ID=MMETSP0127-20121128/9721_1 /TAXON_ID=938130 /ORGANISM="Platyophrya macrostoma, Strain WH" /LENGTH=509 /DNA_ID=CAMNT_0017803263 /DNA_START=48 /DNA_END=1577 /DNA_ORIENTATION=-